MVHPLASLLLHRGATSQECSLQCLPSAQGAGLPALEEEQSPGRWTMHVQDKEHTVWERQGSSLSLEPIPSPWITDPCQCLRMPRAQQSCLSPWSGGLSLGRAPGSLHHSLCQPCLLLDMKCHLLTSSLVLLLSPCCPSAMEVLVSAQAPWPPPDPRGLVHPWCVHPCTPCSRWSTQRLSWCPCVVLGALCACWFAVHVSAHPCSSAFPSLVHVPPLSQLFLLVFWAQKLQFLLSPSTRVLNSCSCCLSSCSNLGWCLRVGSGGEGPAGCDRTFSAWSFLHGGDGKSEPSRRQIQEMDVGMSEGWILEADFPPNGLHPVVKALLKHRQLFPCVSSREEAEGEGRMDGPICLTWLHGF